MSRVVAIVGRPNVGKSAIFNRLVGRRVSIVHAESGVTRDRIVGEATWGDARFSLIDTAGIGDGGTAETAGEIERGVHRQVEAALGDAQVLVQVADVQAGVTALDQEVAAQLRRSGHPTVLAVNKCDVDAHDAEAVVFSELGFPVYPVSALHNRGFGTLMERVLGQLPPPPGPDERVPALRVAVVGRPNVGKSSYINRLLRSERVLVSATPGTTRDSVEIPFRVGHGGASRDYVLIDTAGMRRSGKVRDAVEQYSLLRAERSVEGADLVAVVVDATQGPTAQDKKIASLVLKHRKGCVLLVNKWDMAPGTQRKCLPLIEAQMPFLSHCPVVFISSKTGFNIRRSIDAIDAVAANMQAWLPTGVLNRTLKAAYERVRPPSAAGKPLKIYYAAQVGAAPPRFRVFVNRPRGIPPAYVQYLTKALRRAFALDGVPVRLDFVPRHGPGTQKVARKKKH